MPTTEDADFERLFSTSPAAARDIAGRVLAHARKVLPGAVETCEGGDYGLGTTGGYKGLVFVITPMGDAVRLGIAGGASLDDPAGLLRGRGKVHRHVRLSAPSEADAPALLDLMGRAAERARS